jgi:hypothetical protein
MLRLITTQDCHSHDTIAHTTQQLRDTFTDVANPVLMINSAFGKASITAQRIFNRRSNKKVTRTSRGVGLRKKRSPNLHNFQRYTPAQDFPHPFHQQFYVGDHTNAVCSVRVV